MFQQLKHPQTATELKRPLGNVSFQENVRGGKKKISVDDDKKKKKKRQQVVEQIYVSVVTCSYALSSTDIRCF